MTSISSERSDHGLPVEQTIEQSRAIHPKWTALEHYEYLVNDAFFSEAVAREAVAIVLGRSMRATAAFHDILSGLPD